MDHHLLFPRVNVHGSCSSPEYRFASCKPPAKSDFVGCCRASAGEACDHGCAPEDIDPQDPDSPNSAVSSNTQSIQVATRTAVVTQSVTVQPSTFSTQTASGPTTAISTNQPISGQITSDTPSIGSSTIIGGAWWQTPTSNLSPVSEPGPPTSTSSSTSAHTANSSSSTNLGPIIGCVIGGLFLVLSSLLLFVLYRRRKAKKNLERAEVPYIAVKNKQGSIDSSSDSPTFAHEKRRTDYTDTISTPSIGITSPTSNLPTELPGPINIGPPPSTYAELPDNTPNTSPRPNMKSRFSSPIDPRTSTTSSIVSPLSGSSSIKSSPNTPHIMSWATFDDGFGGKTKTTSSVHPGLYTLTESNSKGSGVDGAVEVKLGERVLGPNGEPVWDAMSNGGAEGGKEGPRIVATGT